MGIGEPPERCRKERNDRRFDPTPDRAGRGEVIGLPFGSDAGLPPGRDRLPLLSWVTVRGPSMAPALHAGDRLLARRIGAAARVRTGAVALVAWPNRPGLLAVKRVVGPVVGGYWVEGDNPLASADSTTLGPAIVCAVVVARCWPWPPWIRATVAR